MTHKRNCFSNTFVWSNWFGKWSFKIWFLSLPTLGLLESSLMKLIQSMLSSFLRIWDGLLVSNQAFIASWILCVQRKSFRQQTQNSVRWIFGANPWNPRDKTHSNFFCSIRRISGGGNVLEMPEYEFSPRYIHMDIGKICNAGDKWTGKNGIDCWHT